MSSEQLAREFVNAPAADRLSPDDVATITGVAVPRVYDWMARGVRGTRLASIAIGGAGKRCGRRFVLRGWLARFLTETNDPGTVPGGAAA